MFIQHQILVFILCIGLLFAGGCGADNTYESQTGQANREQDSQTDAKGNEQTDTDDGQQPGNDSPFSEEQLKKSYTNLAQGKWQEAANPANIIEFEGNKIKQTQDGKLVLESDFVVDPTCISVKCLQDGKQPMGWCFILQDTPGTCQIVTRCDSEKLIYRTAFEGTDAKTFVRVKEN